MDKKGFTMVEILAAITILAILAMLAIGGYTRYIDYARKNSYKVMVKSVSTAAEQYAIDNPGAVSKSVQLGSDDIYRFNELSMNTISSIQAKDLVEMGYLKELQDPVDKEHNCTGKVHIGVISGSGAALDQYIYQVDVCCSTYETRYLYTYKKVNGVLEPYTEEQKESVSCPAPENSGGVASPDPTATALTPPSTSPTISGGNASKEPSPSPSGSECQPYDPASGLPTPDEVCPIRPEDTAPTG